MSRFVNIEAPTDNPDCGMIPDTMAPPVPRRTPIKPPPPIPYEEERIVDRWMQPDPDLSHYGWLPPVPHLHGTVTVGVAGYDPTRSLTIDCDELIANDPGGLPRYRPGDEYREPSWASRLKALHIKSWLT